LPRFLDYGAYPDRFPRPHNTFKERLESHSLAIEQVDALEILSGAVVKKTVALTATRNNLKDDNFRGVEPLEDRRLVEELRSCSTNAKIEKLKVEFVAEQFRERVIAESAERLCRSHASKIWF
jgi:hypothetical protein